MQTDYDVAIIGGGFSGTVLACQLGRCCDRPLSVAILERSGVPGRGIAYGSPCLEHLLNVPSGGMSAFPEYPDHFVEWLGEHAPQFAQRERFVPRTLYGQYIGGLLRRTMAETCLNVQWIEEEASSIGRQSETFDIRMRSHLDIRARYVVLAIGSLPPSDPKPFAQMGRPLYAECAWSTDALRALPDSGSILLLGSGLTAIDQVLALHAQGYRGHIYMLSRRGLVPTVHRPQSSWDSAWTQDLPKSARGLLAAVRAQVKEAASKGCDWQSVVDSLRPNSQKIWQSLPPEEQRRFLRHVRSYWDVHRHRSPPEIQVVMDELRAHRRISLLAGTVLACAIGMQCVEVRYRARLTGAESTLHVDRVVNCTGPESNLRKLQNPLIQSLILQGLARPDALFLGLDVAEDGSLVNANGIPSKALFAIGPLRKGCLWETTAVPEIRVQAESLSKRLVFELSGSLHQNTRCSDQPVRS